MAITQSAVLFFVLWVVCISQGFHTANEPETRLCAFYPPAGKTKPSPTDTSSVNQVSNDEVSEDYGVAEIEATSDDPQRERCAKNIHFCYTAFSEDPVTNGTTIIRQGCWESSGGGTCEESACVPERRQSNFFFCCCTGDLCNTNITATVKEEPEEPVKDTRQDYTPRRGPSFLVWGALLATVGVAALGLALYWSWRGGVGASCKPDPDAVRLMESGRGPGMGYGQIMGTYTGDQLKLINIVGQGRYGSVWRATVNDQEVAVKVFPGHYRTYFLNEKDIYCLPFMADCRALLSYYGCDERVSVEGSPEYLLVLSYSPNGCLQDYLRSKPVDWHTYCRMALSIAKGLAHLHTDIHKGDKVKPCVSHRDLNTRNILVNADLSCSLCDLGFAMKIVGSKYYQNGEEQHAETKSINDVGTLRYMAPEVLEGAVNLRDCESSLKQIDIYALGLVLWELSVRCSDLYQPGGEVPPYRLPFEAEIGHHPTFEQMQVLVLRHKARPLFPETWFDWAAIRLIRETMEDCWDQDAEARLTALCVEERLSELPSLWDRQRSSIYTSGMSPTVNQTQGLSINRSNVSNNNSITNNSISVTDGNRLMFLESTDDTGGSARSSSHKDAHESTASEGTVETLLSPSDTPDSVLYKNWSRGPLQPYQGRNPCMERNLMPAAASEEELNRQGSVLVDRSAKHAPQGHYRSGSSCTDTQALVSHDYLGQQQQQQQQQQPQQQHNQQHQQLNTSSSMRPITPIPFVQNVMYSTNQAVPKLPTSEASSSPRQGLFSGWTGGKLGGGIRKLLDSKKKGANRMKDDPTRRSVYRDAEEGKSNLSQGRDTQVSLSARKSSGVVTTVLNTEDSKESPEDSMPVPALVPTSPALRPNTLSLPSVKMDSIQLRHGSDNSNARKRLSAECQDMFASSSVDWKLKDPTLRIKTPGDVPASVRKNRGRGFATRFSLYDDRMMSGNNSSAGSSSRELDFNELEKDDVLEVCVPNLFSSVPYRINAVTGESEVHDSTF